MRYSWPLTTTQRQTYANEVQERVIPGCVIADPLLLPLYLHFYFFLKRWSLTSNVTPTPTSDPDSPPRLTYPTIFSNLSTSILTFLEAVEPNLQRHPYTTIRFGFPSWPYLPYDLFLPLYLHFNFFL